MKSSVPRSIFCTFVLVDHDDIIVFRFFCSKLSDEAILRPDGLLHLVEATVARHTHCTLTADKHLEEGCTTAHFSRYMHITAAHLCGLDSREVSVVKVVFERRHVLLQTL